MGARTLAVRSLAAVALAAAMVLVAADPATAADELELSTDGVSYADTIATPLFSSADLLVPGDSRQSTFWVRNATSFQTYLRVAINGATYTDTDYAVALTLQGAVPGTTGTPISVASTSTCRVLIYGVSLAPAEEVEVTLTLQLGDLDGSEGQTADVGITVGVLLTEAVGEATDGCSGATTVPVITRPTPGSGPGPATPSPQPTSVVDGGDGDNPGEDLPPFEALGELLANTFAGFDSAFVGWAAAASLAGALAYIGTTILRARRELAALDLDSPQIPGKKDIS